MNEIVNLNEQNEYPCVYTGDKEYELILTDGSFAIGLSSLDDGHIVFHILSEDDGNIFESKNGTACWSCWWLPKFGFFIKDCHIWMKQNLLEVEWGFKFKDKKHV